MSRHVVAFTVAVFMLFVVLGSPLRADSSALEKEALLISFDLIQSSSEFGASTTIAKLLKRDDVNGVAIAFVSSFGDTLQRQAADFQALYDVYRPAGVVILLSVEPSAGSKAIKAVIEEKKVKMPVSLTGKQWVPFQKIAKQTAQNAWPWTFYIDKQGKFVAMESGSPHAESLDKIAKADRVVAATNPKSTEGGEAQPKAPVKPAPQPEDPSASEPSRTAAELTVARPSKGGWKFVDRSDAYGEGLLLVKPLSDDAVAAKSGETSSDGERSEVFALLETYEAIVLVSTLDRHVHTAFGSVVVDPGSKPQLMEAELNLLKKSAKSLRKVSQDANGSLGSLNAGVVSATATTASGKEYEITNYSVPVKKYTYIVTFAHATNVATETRMQEDEIRKKIRFVRG